MPDVITLPADTVWLDGGKLGVAIVQGDPKSKFLPDDEFPEWDTFVAPQAWAQYDKPCGRCGGEWMPGCDCRDGRQVWTVRRPVRRNLADDPTPGWEWSADELLRATIQVVPVVAYGRHNTVGTYVVIVGRRAFLMCNTGFPVDQTELPLDPLPTPGRDFGLIIQLC